MYGILGGYISSTFNKPAEKLGFAKYCSDRLLSCDPKFRNDTIYIFTLLIVKELMMLKNCKSTYLRQATRVENLTRDQILQFKPENLNRYNRTFQVFKPMRGTSMYYEESKKNLFAMLRQFGCPSVFFTFSMAEFQWDGLLKEILETVYRRRFSDEEIEDIRPAERNRIIAENHVQTTLHFHKRVQKIFSLMKNEDFFGPSSDGQHVYSVSQYFFRIEFQQRG